MAPNDKTDTMSQMFQLQPGGDPPPKPDAEDADKGDTDVKAMGEKIAELQGQLLELQAHNKDLLEFATRAPASSAGTMPQPDELLQVPDFTLDGLPDPTLDPTGFRKQLGDRIKNFTGQTAARATDLATKTANQRTTAALSEQSARDRAWQIMRQDYPEIGANEDLVALAATSYVRELTNRGVDPRQAVAQDTKKFVDKVAERAKEIVASFTSNDEEEEGDDGNDGRSLDMISAHAAGTGSRKPPKETQGNFVNELKALQASLKIY